MSLNIFNHMVFVMDPDCVLAKVGIEALHTYSLDKCQSRKG